MIQHRAPISGIAAYRDSYVLTAGYDNQVILWDQQSKTPLARAWHDHLANQVAFAPDGRHAVTSSSDYGARIWSLPELRLVAVLADHEDDVEMSVFHPTRDLVATASRDHRVRVYNLSGTLIATFAGHTADVISVEWSTDGAELISSSDDGTIKRWSLNEARMIDDLDMAGVETDTVAISADGTIYAGNDDGQIIEVTSSGRHTIDAHDAGIKRVVLNDTRKLLVTLSYDRTMKLWSTAGTPQLVATTALPPDVWPRSCAFAGQTHIVFATFGATYRTYDYQQDHWLSEAVPPTDGVNAALPTETGTLTIGDAGIVRLGNQPIAETGSLCNFLVEGGHFVLTGGQLGKVFDARTGAEVYQHRSPLNCGATFRHNAAEHIIIGTYTGEGLIFDVSGPAVTFICEVKLHPNAVKGIAASGDVIFSVAADASATWLDTQSLQVIESKAEAHNKIANGCASLSDERFASISRDLQLRIWAADRTVTELPSPHDHSIKCVSASLDGRFIATGGYHGRVCIYDQQDQTWISNQRPTTAGISSLSYDSETDEFLASSYDGAVYRLPASW